ncbi:MAG: Uma2 family endonuclease [Labilithrix sp.]|nr:Uma2 family endonuclease [Labilithrix sp.]
MHAAKRLATYDDLLALPDGVKGEVIRGVVVLPPAPLPRHSSVQGKLRRFLGGPFDDDDGAGGPGGWWIFLEVDVRLAPSDIVKPDLSGWRRERLPEPWDVRPIDVVPDWICEVVSPSNAGTDRVAKRHLYASSGVEHYWIADPAAGTLETYKLDRQTRRWVDSGAFDATAHARIPPFEAVELDLGRIFPPAPATP